MCWPALCSDTVAGRTPEPTPSGTFRAAAVLQTLPMKTALLLIFVLLVSQTAALAAPSVPRRLTGGLAHNNAIPAYKLPPLNAGVADCLLNAVNITVMRLVCTACMQAATTMAAAGTYRSCPPDVCCKTS